MPKTYYLKLGSGPGQLVGTSCDPHHVGWIKLETFFWGHPNIQSTSAGPGKTSISEFLVSKVADRISPQLMQASNNGMAFKSALIEIADSKTGIPTLRMKLSAVVLDKYAGTGAVGPITETFSVHFGNIEFNDNPIAEDALDEVLQSVFKFMWFAPDRPNGRPSAAK